MPLKMASNPAAVSVERLLRVLRVLDVDLTLAHTTRATPAPGKKESTPGTPLLLLTLAKGQFDFFARSITAISE
jgi:hypothetical protein